MEHTTISGNNIVHFCFSDSEMILAPRVLLESDIIGMQDQLDRLIMDKVIQEDLKFNILFGAQNRSDIFVIESRCVMDAYAL